MSMYINQNQQPQNSKAVNDFSQNKLEDNDQLASQTSKDIPLTNINVQQIEYHQNFSETQSREESKERKRKEIQKSKQYFQKLYALLKENRLFFFNQILTGMALRNLLVILRISCLNKIDDNLINRITGACLNFTTSQCLPICLRPFFAGFFFPMILLYYLCYKYITIKIIANSQYRVYEEITLIVCYFISILLMIIISFRGSGNLNNRDIRQKSQLAIKNKEFQKGMGEYCYDCDIIKSYRSLHCPICKECIPKFSKHSLFLNQCVGAGNQLLFLFLMISIIIAQGVVLAQFLAPRHNIVSSYIITQLLFYFVNNYFQWLAVKQFYAILIYNLTYNCTQFEVSHWTSKLYFRNQLNHQQFVNPFDKGFCKNLKESCYAMIGIQDKLGDTEQKILQQQFTTNNQDTNNLKNSQYERTINWTKSLLFDLSHIHRPRRPKLKQNGVLVIQKIYQTTQSYNENEQCPQTHKQMYEKYLKNQLNLEKSTEMVILTNKSIPVQKNSEQLKCGGQSQLDEGHKRSPSNEQTSENE